MSWPSHSPIHDHARLTVVITAKVEKSVVAVRAIRDPSLQWPGEIMKINFVFAADGEGRP